MSKAKTYTVARKQMTVAQIVEATGINAGKLRVQLTIKGVKSIKKAVILSAAKENMKAVNKLFKIKPKKKVVVDIMSGTYAIVDQAEYKLDGRDCVVMKFENKTIAATSDGKQVPAKPLMREIADKEGMSYKKEHHQRTLASLLLSHLNK